MPNFLENSRASLAGPWLYRTRVTETVDNALICQYETIQSVIPAYIDRGFVLVSSGPDDATLKSGNFRVYLERICDNT